MVNAPEGLNKVILRKMKRFDCKTNQISSKQLASLPGGEEGRRGEVARY